MMNCVSQSSGPTVVWIVTLLMCVSKSPSQSNKVMRSSLSHFRMSLGGKGTYIQILELRSFLESITSDNEAMSMLVNKTVPRSSPKQWNAIVYTVPLSECSQACFWSVPASTPKQFLDMVLGGEHSRDHSQQKFCMHVFCSAC